MLEVALHELDVADAGLRGVAAGQVEHRDSHVQPDRSPVGSEPAGGDEDIGAGAGSQIQDDLAGMQIRDGGRHPAAQQRRHCGFGSARTVVGVVENGAEHDRVPVVGRGHRCRAAA